MDFSLTKLSDAFRSTHYIGDQEKYYIYAFVLATTSDTNVFPELLEGNDRVRKWLKTISQRPAVKRAYEVGRNINTKPTINKDSRKHLIKA